MKKLLPYVLTVFIISLVALGCAKKEDNPAAQADPTATPTITSTFIYATIRDNLYLPAAANGKTYQKPRARCPGFLIFTCLIGLRDFLARPSQLFSWQ